MSRDYWKVPRIWNGATAVILGGGPSLKSLDLSLLRGKRVIAVNCAFRLGQFDACFFGDGAFVERYGEGLREFAGLKITRREEYLNMPWIKVVKQAMKTREDGGLIPINGISTDPESICWNESSGACAINLAVLLGAGRIVLVGFDMQKIENQHNWHSYYPDNDVTAHVDDYFRFLHPFEDIARDLDALGIECINTTPGSALKVFPIMTPEEALS